MPSQLLTGHNEMVVWPGAERLARVIPPGGEASKAIATREDGGSFTSALPAPQRWIISTVVHIIGTKSPAAAIKKGLGTGLGTDRSGEILTRFTPEAKPSTSTARA